MSIKLLKHYKLKGILRCLSGLRIGGTGGVLEIGGVDNPIIRDPLTAYPYVPGSSLKGKMRSLIELKYGKISNNGNPHSYSDECGDKCFICRIFGTSAGEKVNENLGPTRLIVRDAHLTESSKKKLDEFRREQGLLYAEVKSENTLNRITARANPRQMERVPAGTEFEIELVYRIFDTGDDGKIDEGYFKEYVIDALRLVENDALGGSGSRGYGKVKFVDLKLIKEDGTEENLKI